MQLKCKTRRGIHPASHSRSVFERRSGCNGWVLALVARTELVGYQLVFVLKCPSAGFKCLRIGSSILQLRTMHRQILSPGSGLDCPAAADTANGDVSVLLQGRAADSSTGAAGKADRVFVFFLPAADAWPERARILKWLSDTCRKFTHQKNPIPHKEFRSSIR